MSYMKQNIHHCGSNDPSLPLVSVSTCACAHPCYGLRALPCAGARLSHLAVRACNMVVNMTSSRVGWVQVCYHTGTKEPTGVNSAQSGYNSDSE